MKKRPGIAPECLKFSLFEMTRCGVNPIMNRNSPRNEQDEKCEPKLY